METMLQTMNLVVVIAFGLSIVFESAWVRAGSEDLVSFDWSVDLVGERMETVYPDVPFQWTIAAEAIEDYTSAEVAGEEHSTDLRGNQSELLVIEPPVDGFATLTYSVKGSVLFALPAGGATVRLSIRSDTGDALFDRKYNSVDTGQFRFPVLGGHRYFADVSVVSVGQLVGTAKATLGYRIEYLAPHQTLVSASATGFSRVNASEAERPISFQAIPTPQRGGRLRETIYHLNLSDLRVAARVVPPSDLLVSTTWFERSVVHWTNRLRGTATLRINDGKTRIASLPEFSSAAATASFDSEIVILTVEGQSLWAQVLKLPDPPVRLEIKRPVGSEGISIEWDAIPDVPYQIRWLPSLGSDSRWIVLETVATPSGIGRYRPDPALRDLASGFFKVFR